LIKIHVVAWKKFLQKFALLMLNGFDYELIVVGEIKDGARRAGIGKFSQWR
jgi:hypothetical protein